MTTTSHRTPPGTFPFKELPQELHFMIYPHELGLQLDEQPPALFIALVDDPVLHAEMRGVYFKINEFVTASAVRGNAKPLPRGPEVRHLFIRWDTAMEVSSTFPYVSDSRSYSPDKHNVLQELGQVGNNLETITIDNTAGSESAGEITSSIMDLLHHSSRMKRIIVRDPDLSSLDYDFCETVEQKFMFRNAIEHKLDGNWWVLEACEGREWEDGWSW